MNKVFLHLSEIFLKSDAKKEESQAGFLLE